MVTKAVQTTGQEAIFNKQTRAKTKILDIIESVYQSYFYVNVFNKIYRYDFSDPQSGKDVCDRGIATVQKHVRCNINENNDIKGDSDILWRVKGCQVSLIL